MTSRELLYIKTIADEHSFTKAAQKLFISQPSLSHCVSNIEDQLGVRLFRRATGGLVLTYAGEQYYRMAVSVLKMLDDFEADIGEINSLQKGRVNIGVTSTLATLLLPKVLPDFSRKYPGIELFVSELKSSELERGVLSGQLDFAIMQLSHTPSHATEQLKPRIIKRDVFLIAAPPNDKLKAKAIPKEGSPYPELDPALLEGEPFLTVSHGQRIRQITDEVFARAGIRPRIILTGRSYETIRRMVAMGMGYTLVPQRYIGVFGGDEYEPTYYSIPERLKASWDLGIVTLEDGYLSAAASRLLERFEEALREM